MPLLQWNQGCPSCTTDSRPLLDEVEDGDSTISRDERQQTNDNETHDAAAVKTPCFLYLFTSLSVIGGFLFGYDTGVVSGAIILLSSEFSLTSIWEESIISITLGGAAVFALLAGFINDGIGRRRTILISSVVFVVGSVVLAAAPDKAALLIGRLIVGIGIGLTSMTVPMYIAENVPIHLRGRLVTLNNTFITFGQFFASVVAGIFSSDGSNGWRYMFGIAAVPSVIQFSGFLFMPESVRWLLARGRDEQASASLRQLRGTADVAEEINELKTSITNNQSSMTDLDKRMTIVRILYTPHVRRALMVGCGLQLVQQICGINTVMYYSATIIKMSGAGSESTAIWLAVIPALVNFLFTFVGLYLVERVGRRKLIIGSLIGTIVGLMVLAVGFQVEASLSPLVSVQENLTSGFLQCNTYHTCAQCTRDQHCGFCYVDAGSAVVDASCLPLVDHRSALAGRCHNGSAGELSWLTDHCPAHFASMATVGLVLYLACFATGMGPMPWTINSEIYPLWARSTGIAIATTVNWLSNLLVSMTFLTLTETLAPHGTFWLYTALAVVGLVFIYFFVPETKGKDLEEVRELFVR